MGRSFLKVKLLAPTLFPTRLFYLCRWHFSVHILRVLIPLFLLLRTFMYSHIHTVQLSAQCTGNWYLSPGPWILQERPNGLPFAILSPLSSLCSSSQLKLLVCSAPVLCVSLPLASLLPLPPIAVLWHSKLPPCLHRSPPFCSVCKVYFSLTLSQVRLSGEASPGRSRQ
jgi:hypothetical protein